MLSHGSKDIAFRCRKAEDVETKLINLIDLLVCGTQSLLYQSLGSVPPQGNMKKRRLKTSCQNGTAVIFFPVHGAVVDTILMCLKVPTSSLDLEKVQHHLARNHTWCTPVLLGKAVMGQERVSISTTCTDGPASMSALLRSFASIAAPIGNFRIAKPSSIASVDAAAVQKFDGVSALLQEFALERNAFL